MEGDQGNSFRRVSAVLTGNSYSNVFSRSTREEDDEEALKWAAIERLPTISRVRRGLLATSKGAFEVDVHDLGISQKNRLLERLLKETRTDNEKFLRKLRQRIDRVGIQIPTVEVRFERLGIRGDVHVGSRAKVNIVNSVATTVEDILASLRIIPSKKAKFEILKDASGVIKPSRLTLLLGPPSSGKTTFLLALAGKLDPSLKVTGKVTYNGHAFEEFEPQRTAAYVSQYDDHIPEMTVRETLVYSARFQGVGARYDMLQELSRREKAAGIHPDPDVDLFMKSASAPGSEASVITDYVIKILGLAECADIIVGNQVMRGISGGQRKRLTTAEVMVGPSTVLFMDEISTGLDSSTTFEIINCLKQIVQIMEGTALISLLQPAPETYNLFDDVMLISDGLIVFQGPIEEALPFFEHVGFKCPQRKGVADFLQEVTSKNDQQQYWVKEEPYRFVTASDFVEAFQGYSTGKSLAETLAQPFDKSKSHPAALVTTKYGATWQELLRASTQREILLMKKNIAFYIFKFCQLTFLGFLYMTIFLRTEFKKNSVDHGLVYSAILFLCTSIVVFNGIAEVPELVNKLPVYYKQRGLRFFPAWIYALPKWILTIPISFFDMIIFTFIPYYVIGFDSNFGRAMKMFIMLVALNQVGSSLFRLIASVCRNMIVANTLGAFHLVIIIISGGFVTSKDAIKSYWKWAYYINPLMYGQTGLMVNEFLGHSWKKIIPPYTDTLGRITLKIKKFSTNANRYWTSLLTLIITVIIINALNVVALTYLYPYKKIQRANMDDGQGEKKAHANGKKKGMVLPFLPQTLTFEDIVYSVDMPEEMKIRGASEDRLTLLRGISGCFRPGVLTALMGVSGAGKTTLMDVLAGRKTGGYIEGLITVSGHPKKQETFARIAGYCEQNDIHSPCLTVYESLVFSAWLRLSADIEEETRLHFVEEVMELVELKPIRDFIVGVPGQDGLSTEQRKRLTIAVELVANPSIIFMDEPTSGLDARAAAIVMRTVRNTVDTGRTVVCTIHQPSIDIFESFDELLLLKRGGQEIYVGPLGQLSSDLISYFESIQGVEKIVDDHNPAAWMLEVTTPAQEDALHVDFAEIYKKSDLYTRTKETIKEYSKPAPGSNELYFEHQYAQTFLTQCKACLWKHFRSYWSNPAYNSVRLVFTLFISFIFGTMFWDLGSKTNTRQDMSNALGSMYASVLFMGFVNLTSVQPVVGIERAVFYRERAAGMYSPFAYAFGQTVIELPYVFLQTACFVLIIYPMMSFDWTASKFLWYMAFVYCSMLFFTYFGMASVAVTPTQQVALLLANVIFAMGNLFSGFIVSRPDTPVWWRWNCYVTPNAWTLYGLLSSQYGETQDVLEDGQTVAHYLKKHFGFHHDMLGEVFVIDLAFTLLCMLAFCFGIKHLQFQTR